MEIKTDFPTGANCELIKAGPCGMVIFGASGDLAKKKLFPSLYNIFKKRNLPENFFVIGYARTPMEYATFRQEIKTATGTSDEQFLSRCYYISGGYTEAASYLKLASKLKELEKKYATAGNIIFNLAVPPELYAPITACLSKNGMLKKDKRTLPFQRLMVEKPFGHDYESAVALNAELLKYVTEEQLYRIDHYLGKDTVQNILVFRFANSIFEQAWNRDSIDHVQITMSEDIGIEQRTGYFEKAGLIRDVLQNHMLQLLALVAMEPPKTFDAELVQNEKVKVFKAIKPFKANPNNADIIRGQYLEGSLQGLSMKGYRQETGVEKKSCVETFFAAKLFVNNKRWRGVPFYLKAGKRLDKKETKISVVFKGVPKCVFCHFENSVKMPNILTFIITPEQGISLRLEAKVPGSKKCLSTLEMDVNYREIFKTDPSNDYASVILECMFGDQTLFWRKDGVEAAWKILTPVLRKWDSCPVNDKDGLMNYYAAGTSGTKAANEIIEKDGRHWL
ncbi:MAG: glucose-6-phosphate dehydrogenase [bacterium]